MNRIALILCVLFFMSCSEKKSSKKEVPTIVEKKELIVKVYLKTDVEDVFSIRMDNIQVDEFQKKNIFIRETIPLSTGYESITANFGPNNFSKHIHFGLGKKLKTVDLKTIEFTYKGNTLTITKENFNDYLQVNDSAELNLEDFSINTKNVIANKNPEISVKYSTIQFLSK
ncbi:hypothetical protein [Psychroserpens sp. SPM9]|uniref:hypothetical protein n=1 Tax=Psychroserpens sp. SPM9 TaxID=2975598 RepID=UPI0021A40C66|nr:hypothetical protein [Psychroserpens sp. SPM9]MDG5491103.1 hypothetical protein [Psychroserpens sp. SPM9]